MLGKDEVASSNLASSSKTLGNLVFPRVFLISCEKVRPHPFSVILAKGCGLIMRSKIYFPEQIYMIVGTPVLGCLSVFATCYADTPGGVSLRYSFKMLLLHNPLLGIDFNVFPNLIIILLIADHMVIIPGLPDILAVFLVAKPFECANKTSNDRGSRCRDTRPRVSGPFLYCNQKMDMVGHDYIFIHRQIIVK